jgi:UPF0755 protein
MKKILVILALFLFLGIAVAGGICWWGYTAIFHPVNNSEEEVIISIAQNESVAEIGKDLLEKKLIRAPKLFSWYAKFTGKDKKIIPGTYSLFRNMNVPDILQAFVSGKSKNVWFTIPEGWTARQISEKLESLGVVKKEDFLAEVSKGEFDFDFLKGKPKEASLEGYLFPDTYKIEFGKDAHYIVEKMLTNFEKKVNSELLAEIKAQGKNLHDVVILASIVEKEASKSSDRKKVASVFYNRLKAGYPLASCATLQYEKGTSNRYLSAEEVADPSSWNTYNPTGLPPGPIGNPGLDSLKAVIYPDQTNYYFFLSDEYGNTYFAETQAEQDANQEKYIRK